MPLERSRRRTGALRPARVSNLAMLRLNYGLEPTADESPGTHVARLFLNPHHFAGSRIASQHLGELRFGERIKLFDADQRRIRKLALIARGQQLIVDLSATHQNLSH